jgi:glycogen synthase
MAALAFSTNLFPQTEYAQDQAITRYNWAVKQFQFLANWLNWINLISPHYASSARFFRASSTGCGFSSIHKWFKGDIHGR